MQHIDKIGCRSWFLRMAADIRRYFMVLSVALQIFNKGQRGCTAEQFRSNSVKKCFAKALPICWGLFGAAMPIRADQYLRITAEKSRSDCVKKCFAKALSMSCGCETCPYVTMWKQAVDCLQQGKAVPHGIDLDSHHIFAGADGDEAFQTGNVLSSLLRPYLYVSRLWNDSMGCGLAVHAKSCRRNRGLCIS
jgi:hypothetical protein